MLSALLYFFDLIAMSSLNYLDDKVNLTNMYLDVKVFLVDLKGF